MKKILAIMVAAVLVAGLAACGSSSSSTTAAPAETEAATEAATEAVTEAAPAETAAAEETTAAAGGFTNEITINLMGTDVPVTMEIGDDGFTASYSFNGNDVVAMGTFDENGGLILESYTPESVPEQYVQGALDLVAEEFAAGN